MLYTFFYVLLIVPLEKNSSVSFQGASEKAIIAWANMVSERSSSLVQRIEEHIKCLRRKSDVSICE